MAMELMMTGERGGAQEALRLGLLNRLYPVDEFAAGIREFASRLSAGPPEALAAIKQGVHLGAECPLDEALAFEASTQRRIFLSDVAR